MAKNLVIVESPAKAKTIEKFLGKDFVVKSSFGHVRDLSKKELGVNIEKDFEPIYEITPDKKKTVAELKKLAKGVDIVWLATDEDREGEAISWHLLEALKLDEKKTKRIAFHEITKTAIQDAIKNPRTIDRHLVDAQQARRVLDRLVGFEISPVLWRKIKPSLSAGRVQSVAVRLVVEREESIKAFKQESSFKVVAKFDLKNEFGNAVLNAELPKRFKEKKEALAFLNECIPANFVIGSIEKKPGKKSPAAPFTTSTLQQEASRKLGFSVSKTMVVAQQLYESGKITYMRTDSVNLSKLALGVAKNVISKNYGESYVKVRQFKTKSKSAQEAHEAIRPTYLENQVIEGDASQKRLYDLIWKRTIASQMADAKLEKTNVSIDISTSPQKFVAKGEVIQFDGFLKVYLESTDDNENGEQKGVLPKMKKGETLKRIEISAAERFSQPPPRYTEASLVKKMEELGIGRPSTYAPTISTIQKREYVVKEEREGIERKYEYLLLADDVVKEEVKTEKTGFEKGKLYPTDIGNVVNGFLVEHFPNILDYNFTANVEKEFDEIADGVKVWNKMIKEFYKPFHGQVEETLETSKKHSGERLLGKDPKSGKNVYARIGRYGGMIQIGESTDEEKPKFAGLRKGQSIDEITFEEAMEMFKLPREVGNYEDKPIMAALGRFGPYVKHDNKFYSLEKTDDPMTVEQDRAIELIEKKRKVLKERVIKLFKEDKSIEVLNGRFGPYISKEKKNYRIPKGKGAKEAKDLTLEDCLEIIEKGQKKKKRSK